MNMNTRYTQRVAKTFALGVAVAVAGSMLLLCGCTSGQRADLAAFGHRHRIEMYSGGTKVREWVSVGYVESADDRCHFRDEKTGLRIMVSGDVIITTLRDEHEGNK